MADWTPPHTALSVLADIAEQLAAVPVFLAPGLAQHGRTLRTIHAELSEQQQRITQALDVWGDIELMRDYLTGAQPLSPSEQAAKPYGDGDPIAELRRAIHDPGPARLAHRATLARHRAEWPTLWRAIDHLLAVPSPPAGDAQEGNTDD